MKPAQQCAGFFVSVRMKRSQAAGVMQGVRSYDVSQISPLKPAHAALGLNTA